MPTSSRGAQVPSFKVMDVVARAAQLEAAGRSICHLEVGQPLKPAPAQVIAAAHAALDAERLGYTASLGIPALRQAIAAGYAAKYADSATLGAVDPGAVVVTTGSSAGFLLTFTAAFDAGDVVAVPTTCYPCYRNILHALGVTTASLPLNPQFKITAADVDAEVARRAAADPPLPRLSGLVLSSPSNPTGATLSKAELYELCDTCEAHGIRFISDEIYHGIVYGALKGNEATAMGCPSGRRSAIVVNSFSKYACMTGWRLGWLVLPADPALAAAVNRLSQNMFINAPTLAQHAAVASFGDAAVDAELDARVTDYARSREVVLQALADLGLDDVAPADGAFYVYVDLGAAARDDSQGLSAALLEEAGVAVTPGVDFEDAATGLGQRRIRFSYAGGVAEVAEGMRRFREWWPTWLARG